MTARASERRPPDRGRQGDPRWRLHTQCLSASSLFFAGPFPLPVAGDGFAHILYSAACRVTLG
jgi:hypothetical protein